MVIVVIIVNFVRFPVLGFLCQIDSTICQYGPKRSRKKKGVDTLFN